MEKGRDNTLLLTVIGIATLLVAVAGATFAYFTAQTRYTDESGSTLTIYSGDGRVNTAQGGSTLTVDNIYPVSGRVWATKVFTYSTTPSGDDTAAQKYTLNLHYINGFNDGSIAYNLIAVKSTDALICSTGFEYNETCSPDVNSTALAEGESFVNGSDTTTGNAGTFLKASVEKTISFEGGIINSGKHVYKLEISYPETGVNQNAGQGKTISVRMTITPVY